MPVVTKGIKGLYDSRYYGFLPQWIWVNKNKYVINLIDNAMGLLCINENLYIIRNTGGLIFIKEIYGNGSNHFFHSNEMLFFTTESAPVISLISVYNNIGTLSSYDGEITGDEITDL